MRISFSLVTPQTKQANVPVPEALSFKPFARCEWVYAQILQIFWIYFYCSKKGGMGE